MSALDGTIVTTALVKISSGFGALDRAAWLVTAYLLTYNGILPPLLSHCTAYLSLTQHF